MAEKKEFLASRRGVNYLDLFAGAGGFSEGFMQAYTDDKFYDFRLASDINENCELTHRVRYNKMLGLDTDFLCQDIMEDSFLPNLMERLHGQEIDVITGGPSCQSFSLAGRRKKLDKRDDLFYHYLKVIKALRPKYFVMENVKGILTKDEGRIKERILREIRSIVDDAKMSTLLAFLNDHLKVNINEWLYDCLYTKMCMEDINADMDKLYDTYFNNLEQQLKNVTKHLPYSVSKSNVSVNTVRHGILLLSDKKQREEIRKQVIQLKTSAHIDNDTFVDSYNAIVETISDEKILENMLDAVDKIIEMDGGCEDDARTLKKSLEILTSTFDECIDFIREQFKSNKKVLDCFTHMGTFALNAGIAGASDVTGLDISEYAVSQAEANARLNGLQDTVHFRCANVLDELPKIAAAGEKYDVVILDPPAFTKSREATKNAIKGYREINMKGLKLVKDGGYLATCSCSHFMTQELLAKTVKEAAKATHKRLRQVEFRTQAPDHPILWAADESYYLKFFIFQVVEEK